MTEVEFMGRAAVAGVPDHDIESLSRYVFHRIPTGDFLRAFLANDLYLAAMRADIVNRYRFKEICEFIHAYVSSDAWGDYSKVDAWLSKKGDT